MRTITDATLYVVDGPRGAYFALYEHETGAVLTERTEAAAGALARDKDMVIVDRRNISHPDLLALMAARPKSPGQNASSDFIVALDG